MTAKATSSVCESDTQPIRQKRSATLLCILLVAAAAFAVGWPTRNGEFLPGDDHQFIIEHVYVNHPTWRNAWNLLTMVHSDLRQPLPMLTFQANYAAAGPDPSGQFPVNPWGFHVTNIVLHMLNAMLVFLVATWLSRCRRIGLITGLLFACHPFAVESVAWMTGRMVLLTSTFSLTMILVCLRRRPGHEGRWALAAMAARIGSLLSKVLLSVPFAAVWCDVQRGVKWTRWTWTVYAILFLMTFAGAGLALKSTYDAGLFELSDLSASSSLPVRALVASRYYFENYVWPLRLSPWAPPPDCDTLFSANAGIGLAEWAVFMTILIWSRRSCRTAFNGLVLYVILIAPFLAAISARTFLTADRYLYLPILGLHLAVAGLLVKLLDALGKKRFVGSARLLVIFGGVALLVATIQLSRQQGRIWNNMLAQVHWTLELFPDNPDAHSELAGALAKAGRLDDALVAVHDALKRWPENARLRSRAGDIYRRKREWPNALKELSAAVERSPDQYTTLYLLGLVLDELDRDEEARAYYRRVLTLDPDHLNSAVALARSYEKAGDWDTALQFHRRALEINPFHRDSLLSIAVILMRKHEWSEARRPLQSILNIEPDDPAALLNLGVVLARENRLTDAMEIDNRLIALNPDNLTARVNRASLLSTMGRSSEAADEFRAILAKDADHRGALIGLHEVLQLARKYPALVDLWRQYSGTSIPEDERLAWLGWSLVLTGDSRQAVNNALRLKPGTQARDFANWTIAYLALTRDEARSIPNTLGPPKPPTNPSVERLEWLHVVSMGFDSLPVDKRNSPAGLYILARLSLENGNVSVAEQAARHVMQETANEQLKNAADVVLKVIAESHKRARQQ